MKTIFGPVPSRRLGRSLGIDVIPPKTCSYDCVYCESGPTTHLTMQRQPFVDPDTVMHELEEYFAVSPHGVEVLTFSSAGEPTLYEPLGGLLKSIKRHFGPLPVVVLTNGSLLDEPAVRCALAPADRVVPSLDAVTPEVFARLNRPHPHLSLTTLLEGLRAFRREYRGQLHVEVALVAGFNDGAQELGKIGRALEGLSPDRIELNTVVRPPAVEGIVGLNREEMTAASVFFPNALTQIVGQFRQTAGTSSSSNLDDRILDLIRRRPCTPTEMASSLGVKPEELHAALRTLQAENSVVRHTYNDREYLCPAGKAIPCSK